MKNRLGDQIFSTKVFLQMPKNVKTSIVKHVHFLVKAVYTNTSGPARESWLSGFTRAMMKPLRTDDVRGAARFKDQKTAREAINTIRENGDCDTEILIAVGVTRNGVRDEVYVDARNDGDAEYDDPAPATNDDEFNKFVESIK